ncbi:MAG: flagellar basal body rod protein FlgB [Lachnospirales bacterium]
MNLSTVNKVLEAGMNASIIRNEAIQSNIANADTPYYKKRTVNFEDSLNKELNSALIDGKIDFNNIKATINNTGFNYRLDENNVDMEAEMVALYQNSVKYELMTQSVISNFARLDSVLAK